MAAQPPTCDFGAKAPDFSLPSTDGKTWSLADVAGEKGTVLIFICNHCPYVKGIIERLVMDAQTLQTAGIGVAAICANDATSHPADSFEKMAEFAKAHAFPFPYLHDESQEVARAYGAVCTPDFFGYNSAGELQYRGRLDAFGKKAAPADAPRELVEAMMQVATTGKGPEEQVPSMGCSIKWKAE
ncbi:thioredoxin family protein [Oceanicola sp. D3]|uniref:thioredoxin family protein n=1 Tax=Oceanicola sp. D3 TaxID=2587163 RepID=UPI001122E5FD|nr:thioredoxin family protein [Oceanicola sp. D3]QDC08969.1 thioredoxin family protein [Oceanicola sp. D3]